MHDKIKKIVNIIEEKLENEGSNIRCKIRKVQDKYESETDLFKVMKLVENEGIYLDEVCIVELNEAIDYDEQVEMFHQEFNGIESLTNDFFVEVLEENGYYQFYDNREECLGVTTKEFYVTFGSMSIS